MNLQHEYLPAQHIDSRRHEAHQQRLALRISRARRLSRRAERLADRARIAADRMT